MNYFENTSIKIDQVAYINWDIIPREMGEAIHELSDLESNSLFATASLYYRITLEELRDNADTEDIVKQQIADLLEKIGNEVRFILIVG